MSHRGQYQLLTVGGFSVGLLFLVSALFDGDGKTGALDRETQAIVHRLRESPEPESNTARPEYEVAVAKANSSHADVNPWAIDTDSAAPAAPESQAQGEEDATHASPESTDLPATPTSQDEDVGPILK